jgi:Ca2+-binding EF-hand superfamily protein
LIDKDKNGYLQREEIEEYLKIKMGLNTNENIINDIFNNMDENHDQKVVL